MYTKQEYALVWWASCSQCGWRGTFFIPPAPYGTRWGITRKGETVEFFMLEDPVLGEVRKIFDSLMDIHSKKGNHGWNLILSEVCDRAPSELRYDFTGVTYCQSCGQPADHYGLLEDEGGMVDMPQVTHSEWMSLTEAEKKARVREVLMQAGCL